MLPDAKYVIVDIPNSVGTISYLLSGACEMARFPDGRL